MKPTQEEVEAVAAIISPHLARQTYINPDCDDQNRERDRAYEIARAAIAAMPDRLNMDAMVECRANGIEPIDKAQELVERKPTHRCKICDALWLKYDDGTWSLCSSTCGLCCDNVPMGDQIEPIRPSWNELRRRAAAKTLAAMPRPSNEDRLREALGQAMVVIDYAAEYLWNGRPDAIQQRPVHIDTALRISRKALKSSEGEGL